MKIVVTRDGVEKSRDFQEFTYNDKAAVEFLASIFKSENVEDVEIIKTIN